MSDHAHSTNYVKIWAILLALLVISILGPELNMKAVTLVTAFGIAVVKAVMVANKFMHLSEEKKYISYLLLISLAFLFLFFFAIAPDIMRAEGQNWKFIGTFK